jgi:cellulose synthase/poly-beta-1,6-N-acetylglucosamine synthase-like glycosyltransferase
MDRRAARFLDRVSDPVCCWRLVWSLTRRVRRRKRYRNRPSLLPSALLSSAPGVSILRPLKGLDISLSENLESSFKQDYPNFEIIFSVADEDDEALPVVRELISRYPNVNARIILGGLLIICTVRWL